MSGAFPTILNVFQGVGSLCGLVALGVQVGVAIVQHSQRRADDRQSALRAVRWGTPPTRDFHEGDVAEFIRNHPTSALRSEPLPELLKEAFPGLTPADLAAGEAHLARERELETRTAYRSRREPRDARS